MIRGINHVTFAVSDLQRAVAFYRDALGLALRYQWNDGAYLEAGDAWICLSLDAATTWRADYTHLAFDIAAGEFDAAVDRLKAHGAQSWKDNRSEGASYYFLDPDGHKLEIHTGTLESRLAHYGAANQRSCGPQVA